MISCCKGNDNDDKGGGRINSYQLAQVEKENQKLKPKTTYREDIARQLKN